MDNLAVLQKNASYEDTAEPTHEVFTGVRGTLFISVLVTYMCYSIIQRNKKSVPGPTSLPIIGSLLSLGTNPLKSMQNLRKKYGDIFQVDFGSKPVIMLNGLSAIREAMLRKGDVLSGRPDLYSLKIASEGKSMCFNSYSPQWKVHRRLAEKALRLTSNAPSFLDDVVSREAKTLAGKFMAADKSSFDPSEAIFLAVAHVKHSLCYGDSHLDEDFFKLAQYTMELNDCYNANGPLDFFPWAKYLFQGSYKRLNTVCRKIINIQYQKEEEHLKTYEDGRIRDAMDALIKLGIKETKYELDTEQVLHTVLEFTGAGLDIVYMTMRWVVLYLAAHPEAQAKIQEEIDDMIGDAREPRVKDRQHMPYTQACIAEILRHSSVVPLTLPHETLEETTLQGYQLPEKTFVLVNIHSVNYDAEIWGDPESFRPERFLLPNNKLNKEKLDKMCSFGLGKRRCVGEKLSQNELFLNITNLLQRCTLSKPLDTPSYDFKPENFGLVLKPKSYKVDVIPRSTE